MGGNEGKNSDELANPRSGQPGAPPISPCYRWDSENTCLVCADLNTVHGTMMPL